MFARKDEVPFNPQDLTDTHQAGKVIDTQSPYDGQSFHQLLVSLHEKIDSLSKTGRVAKAPKPPKIRKTRQTGMEIMNYLLANPTQVFTVWSISQKTGCKEANISAAIGKLKSKGLVSSPRRGHWQASVAAITSNRFTPKELVEAVNA